MGVGGPETQGGDCWLEEPPEKSQRILRKSHPPSQSNHTNKTVSSGGPPSELRSWVIMGPEMPAETLGQKIEHHTKAELPRHKGGASYFLTPWAGTRLACIGCLGWVDRSKSKAAHSRTAARRETLNFWKTFSYFYRPGVLGRHKTGPNHHCRRCRFG